jgi:site-specific recombinase XerD
MEPKMSIQEDFQNWITTKEKNSLNAANTYSKAINKISQHYTENEKTPVDIYKINNLSSLKNIAREYIKGGKYEIFGKSSHNLYSAAIKKYLKFFEFGKIDGIEKTKDAKISSQETIKIKGIDVPLYKASNEKIQDFVRKILRLMFENNLLPESEIKKMLSQKYCKDTFGIDYPIINNDMVVTYDQNRCWVGKIADYYVCSQWWRQYEDIYTAKISDWIKKIKKINGGEDTKDDAHGPQEEDDITEPIPLESDNKEEFEKWMIEQDDKEKNTVSQYKSAINAISRHYSQQTNKNIDLYTINDFDFVNRLVEKYSIGGKYQKIGQDGHGTVRCAIAAYARFLEQKYLGYDPQLGKKGSYTEINPKEIINIKGIEIPLYKSRDEKTQDFVKKILPLMFKNKLLPDSEIKNMLRKDYCKKTFGIQYPILNNDMVITNNLYRTWVDKIFGYYVCSQWWKKLENKYKIKISDWIRKVKRINDGEEVEGAGDKTQNDRQKYNAKTTNSIIDKETIINKALKLILPSLVEFIGNSLMKYGKNDLWKKYVYNKLTDNAKRNLPDEGSFDKLIKKLDISACLHTIINNRDDIFKNVLKKKQLDCAHGLLTIRNDDSHFTLETISKIEDEDLEHALILIIQLMRPINPDIANQISEIKNELNIPQNP